MPQPDMLRPALDGTLHRFKQLRLLFTPWLKLGGEPMPSWTRLRSKPRQRAERSSQKPGIRQQLEIRNRRAQPQGCRASRGAPRAEC
eukprot:2050473-Alexandrium_andersonii.AAC.1